ncbi:MAG TPA: pyridoxal phosphate-dependent aminotransferase [Planctomycetota bacterium]|nr:pyridoxal phosphate-dependent aminotransferase [Planctomycetota bacterium]
MTSIAERIAGLKPSPVRMMMEGAPPDASPLGLGEPSWDLPEPGRRALAEAGRGVCAYGPNNGIPELRAAIGRRYGASADEVLVTAGSQAALFALYQAFLGPGDEALIPDPWFPAYAALAQLAGAGVASYALDPADGFRLDAAAFERALDAHPRAKLAVVGAPANPTGAGVSADALRRVAAACAARDVLLISDEVYRDLYLGAPVPGLRDVASSGVVVSSLSKGWGAPGLRIGWISGDPKVLAAARTLHSYLCTSAALPSQRAALALIEASDDVLPAARREMSARWEAFASAARDAWGVEPRRPDGAFYYWTAVPAHAGTDDLAFALRLRDEARTVVTPGFAFGPAGRGRLRLGFAARPELVAEGVRRTARLWRGA